MLLSQLGKLLMPMEPFATIFRQIDEDVIGGVHGPVLQG